MTLSKGLFIALSVILLASCSPKPEDAVPDVLKAFEKKDAVTFFDKINLDNFSKLTTYEQFDDSTFPEQWRNIDSETIKTQYVSWFNSSDRSAHPYDPFFQLLARRYAPADLSQVNVSDLAMNGNEEASVVISYPTARFGNTISFKTMLYKDDKVGWYVNGISEIVNNDTENDSLEFARYNSAKRNYEQQAFLFEEVSIKDVPTELGSNRIHKFRYIGESILPSVTLRSNFSNKQYKVPFNYFWIEDTFQNIQPGQEIDLVFEGFFEETNEYKKLPQVEQNLHYAYELYLNERKGKLEFLRNLETFTGLTVPSIEIKKGEILKQPQYWEQL
jgi:hypothetical protein